MININDYSFEPGKTTSCDKFPIRKECKECIDDLEMDQFESDVDNRYKVRSPIPACLRYKITKNIEDENFNN